MFFISYDRRNKLIFLLLTTQSLVIKKYNLYNSYNANVSKTHNFTSYRFYLEQHFSLICQQMCPLAIYFNTVLLNVTFDISHMFIFFAIFCTRSMPINVPSSIPATIQQRFAHFGHKSPKTKTSFKNFPDPVASFECFSVFRKCKFYEPIT